MDFKDALNETIKRIGAQIKKKKSELADERNSLRMTQSEDAKEKIMSKTYRLEEEIEKLNVEYRDLSGQLEIINMVEGVIGQVQFYIPLAQEVVDKTKGGVNDIIKLLLSVYFNISEGTEAEAEKVQELQAKAVLRKYRALKNAFKGEKKVSHEDIMHMVLAQLGPTGLVDTLKKVGQSIPRK